MIFTTETAQQAGSKTSQAKAASSRENGKKGGRPRKQQRKEKSK